jgi:metallo-beta-lactamase family protein
MKLTFLGAAGTVTGSKYLLEAAGHSLLIDAGMFQGDRKWREENWVEPHFKPGAVEAVLLTHAHIDHTGMLPRFVKLGLKCPVFTSAASADLARLVLLDSAHLQEEDADYRARKAISRHHPPLPLYTTDDANRALGLVRSVPFHKTSQILPGITATWNRMGHILGAGSIVVEAEGKRLVFSGDVGRYAVPILKDPEAVALGDLLLIEATYGDRLHDKEDPKEALARVVNDTVKRGGVVVIPAFAIGRTQLVLFYLRELKAAKRIPDIPVVVDSPMASDTNELYLKHREDYDEQALGILNSGQQPFSPSRLSFTKSVDDSKRLNTVKDSTIIISASGMLSGGRILHHLQQHIGDPNSTVLFVGFQPPGSRGAWIKSGANSVRLFGQEVPIHARIEEISGLSAHGDRDELLRWCRESRAVSNGKGPGKVMVVHAEPDAAKSFQASLQREFKWNVNVAEYLSTIEI